jgi:hypothetical protein
LASLSPATSPSSDREREEVVTEVQPENLGMTDAELSEAIADATVDLLTDEGLRALIVKYWPRSDGERGWTHEHVEKYARDVGQHLATVLGDLINERDRERVARGIAERLVETFYKRVAS